MVTASLARIAMLDQEIGAFTWLNPNAVAEAQELSRELAAGSCRGPLHGIPVAVKELFDVQGAPRTGGSLVLDGEVAATDSPLVARIREAGAVVVGTTRSHEFAWGITTQHEGRGSTANPWDLRRVPGGSSGGAAAAVASGMVPISIGTDTAGSIRIPAAFCGVVGFKPSRGVLSLDGCTPLAPSFDTAGVMAATVEGVDRFMTALGSLAPQASAEPESAWDPDAGVEGLAVGYSPALIEFDLPSERLSAHLAVLALLASRGARLVELDVPPAADLRRAFATVQAREALDVHSRILGTYPLRRDSYGADVVARLDAAARLSESDEVVARARIEEMSRRFILEMDRIDVLVTPITTVAPSLRADPDFVDADAKRTALRDAVLGFSIPQNAYGLPAAVIPWGTASDGLPMSIQVSAGPERDWLCLRAAGQLARLLPIRGRGRTRRAR